MRQHVAVLQPKWLARFRSGEKRAELRLSKRPPLARRAAVGDVVHLRAVGEAPTWSMDVERVLDLGYCNAAQLRAVRATYGRALGFGDEPVPYLDACPGAFVVLVFLRNGRPSRETRAPRYQPWAILA
jgi:hypothetical protein